MKMNVKNTTILKQLLQPVAFLLWAVGCFFYFDTAYRYHFFYQEQNQIFLLSPDYLASYLDDDGWLSMLIGDFLTQFYYYVHAGAAILTASIVLLGIFVSLALRLNFAILDKRSYAFSTIIPMVVALILMTVEARFSLSGEYRLSHVWTDLGWVCLLFLYALFCGPLQKWLDRKLSGKPTMPWRLSQLVFMLIMAVTVVFGNWCFAKPMAGHFAEPETNVEKVLAYDNEYYFGHYNKVIEMAQENPEGLTDEQSYFYFLALAQTESIADHLNDVKNVNLGTFTKIDSDTPLFTIKMINELYYLLGDMTYAERAALMACTFAPNNRNVRMLKRLVEVNLVKNDMPAARKYLRILEKTLVYRQWAKDHTPETMTAEVKADIERRRAFMNTQEGIRLGDNCRTILLELLDSNPKNTVALDYLLCSDILVREIVTFYNDYQKYGPRHKDAYEEVLRIYEANAPKMLGNNTNEAETPKDSE